MRLFAISILLVLALSMLIYIGSPRKIYRFFKTSNGAKVLFGVVAFIFGLGSLVVFSLWAQKAEAEELEYFSYAEVFIGVDNTFKVSPQCFPGENSDKATSNGGVRMSIVRNKRASVNVKYTHHSCAFNQDRETYDAIGLEATWLLWGNK